MSLHCFSKFRSPKCHHTQQQQIRMFWNGTWPFLLTQKSCWSTSGSMEQGRGSVLNAGPWTLNPRAQKVNLSWCVDFYWDLFVPWTFLSLWRKIYYWIIIFLRTWDMELKSSSSWPLDFDIIHLYDTLIMRTKLKMTRNRC